MRYTPNASSGSLLLLPSSSESIPPPYTHSPGTHLRYGNQKQINGQNMLAIHPSKETPGTIHLLPCHVKHTGSANATKHWVVNAGEVDGTKVAHFRGRKLVGKAVSLPEGYSGHVLTVTDEVPKGAIERSKRNRPVEEGEEKREVKVFKGLANFDDVVVWGHDIAPEEGGEYVVKGMNEWIELASKIHGFGDGGEGSE